MRKTTKPLAALALFAVVGLTGGASVAHSAEPSTFDVTVVAATCANCHGTDGRSPGSIPTIAGRPESILAGQLQAFRSNNPPVGTTVMNRLAKGLSDDQIAALAAHFSRIPKTEPAREVKKK